MTHQSRVLLVGERQDVSRVLKAMLEHGGWLVTVIEHGRQALAIVAKEPRSIAIVLTTVELADMSGTQLARRIVETAPSTIVAFLSSDPGFQVGEQKIPVLHKPIYLRVLLETMRELVSHQQARTQGLQELI